MADKCVLCGRCLAVCPVYGVTRDEKTSARGRQALMEARSEKRLEEDRVYRRAITSCLLCGACERACVNEVPVREKVIRARTGLPGGLVRLALAQTIHPGRLDLLLGLGGKTLRLTGVSDDSGLRLRLAGEMTELPLPAEKFFGQTARLVSGPAQAPGLVLFPGCLVNYLFPSVGLAALRVLVRAGYRVIVPPSLGCCGLPAESAGLARLAGARALRTSENLKEAARHHAGIQGIVVLCASCQRRLQSRAYDALGLPWPVIDLVEALAGRNLELTGRPDRITFHDPCHSLDRGEDAPQAARKLIREIPGVNFIESNTEPSCCGAGGLFSVSHPGPSRSIGLKKAHLLEQSGADTVATTCPACLWRLMSLASQSGLRALHLAQVLDERRPEP